MLGSVKVPSDPAQVIVNHASFRVHLGGYAPLRGSTLEDTEPLPAMTAVTAPPSGLPGLPGLPGAASGAGPGAGPEAGGGGVRARRRAPVVWSGRTNTGEGDAVATELLQAVRPGGIRKAHVPRDNTEATGSATRLLPRPGPGEGPAQTRTPGVPGGQGTPSAPSPTVVGPRAPRPSETTQRQPRLLDGVRPAGSAFDDTGATQYAAPPSPAGEPQQSPQHLAAPPVQHAPHAAAGPQPLSGAARRQAYYPGRRMNLGVVLLPLRVFLGFISVYAGMGKLCDPVYFDGGERGSMVTWLRSLHPWTIASPLRDLALEHPVGSGLTVAFLQVIVGVLTVCGLWQRLAASVGTLLSAALLVTVSWSTVPAYDAPDIIYLAAWSPLIIAGAPVYSVDAKLATDAWRRLGPRAPLWDLRRRVLRRGAMIATLVAGLALIVGSMLGGAMRSAQTATVPRPGDPPANQLPGSPLPREPGGRRGTGEVPGGQNLQGTQGNTDRRHPAGPSASASSGPGQHKGGSSTPSQRETVHAPQQSVPGRQAPSQTQPGGQHGGTGASGPSGTSGTSGTSGGAGGSGGGNSSGSGGSSSGGGNGGSSSGGNGGGLGGLLG